MAFMRVPSCRGAHQQSRGPAGFPLSVGLWPGGVPWQEQSFQVTQRRVSVLSCDTVNVPCFPGAVWTVAKTPPDAVGHQLSLDQHFLLTQRLHWKWPQRPGGAGASRWPAWAAGLTTERRGQGKAVNHVSSGFFRESWEFVWPLRFWKTSRFSFASRRIEGPKQLQRWFIFLWYCLHFPEPEVVIKRQSQQCTDSRSNSNISPCPHPTALLSR